jgi:response regulator RpfG family c-di-GMP phosphodiesterase
MEAEKLRNAIKVLFVDDEVAILKSIRRFCRARGWDVTLANSGAEALDKMAADEFDVIISDMRMPQMDGAAVLEHAYKSHPNTARIILSGYSDSDAMQHAVNEAHIFKFISKPWDDDELAEVITNAAAQKKADEERAELAEATEQKSQTLGKVALLLDKKAKESSMEVEQAMSIINTMNSQAQTRLMESLNVLNQIVEWREGRDAGHSRFVAHYAEKIAAALSFSESQTQDLVIASMLHRIGMVCIPESICSRPYYELSPEEREKFMSYPKWGEKALKQAKSLAAVAKIIRHHREYVNGRGLPDGLVHNDIPIESKIICLLGEYFDVFNGRLDRNISGTEQAKEYISSWEGKRYDTQLTQIFLKLLEQKSEECWQIRDIESSELEPGMIIDADVIADSGILLLTKGTKLTNEMIQHIVEFEKQNNEKYSIKVAIDTCKNEQEEATL